MLPYVDRCAEGICIENWQGMTPIAKIAIAISISISIPIWKKIADRDRDRSRAIFDRDLDDFTYW